MKRRTMMTTVGFAVLVAGLLVNAPAEANGAFKDRTTHLVLEHPVRVPGATLPAGHYLFTVDPSHRVVWIHNEDDSHVYGPYFTRVYGRYYTWPSGRLERKIVVEPSADANGIPTLRAWHGRFQLRGYELVYPRPSGD